MGFVGPERSALVEQLGIELDARGNIARDGTYATSLPGVFAAGDAGRGQSLIVMGDRGRTGLHAAVDTWLTGTQRLPSPIPDSAPAGRLIGRLSHRGECSASRTQARD